MRQVALLITALLMMFTLAPFPAAAQLVGTDTAPGSSCVGFPDGATRVTADADLDGAEVVLVCDGTTWNAMATDADTLDGLDSLQFLRSDTGDTLNIGRGDVYIENNVNDGDGAGIALRTSANPTTGAIFTVRSSGQVVRLWAGQDKTGTGNTDLLVGMGNDGTGGTAVWHAGNDGAGQRPGRRFARRAEFGQLLAI